MELLLINEKLQEALTRGWKEFREGENLKLFQEFSNFINGANFYESKWRNIIPNPAYDNAAKLIGKYFLKTAVELGLQFDTLFPGDFQNSKEFNIGSEEARQFSLTGYSQSRAICNIIITFTHLHGDQFDFPTTPQVKVALL